MKKTARIFWLLDLVRRLLREKAALMRACATLRVERDEYQRRCGVYERYFKSVSTPRMDER